MDANGVLQPQGTATDKIVNGVDDFTQFAASNPTSTVTRREEARFYWQGTQIGKSTTEGNATGSKEAVLTDPVLMYTILSTPLSPWDVSDDPATDDRNQPWVSALDFAAAPAKGNASGKNAVAALAAITDYLYSSRAYDGASHYTIAGTFNYTGYIADSAGHENCLDSAVGLSITARIVGMDLIAKRRTEFFGYNFHCFTVWGGSHVYDSCSAMTSVSIRVPYVTYVSWGSPGPGSIETTETWPIV